MALEHVFESRPGHGATACVEEKFRHGSLTTDRKPCTKIGTGPLPNRQHSFAPAFSDDADERLRLKGHVIDPQTDKLGDSKACHKAHIQHSSIADSGPSLRVRDIQYGLHLFEREMCHQFRIGLLKRYRQNLSDLL
jgi:hypothetical protein